MQSGDHARLRFQEREGRYRFKIRHAHLRSCGPGRESWPRSPTAIGIGGDPIIGTTTLEAVQLFANDPETEAIVMIGEIGGDLEIQAARWIKANCKKP